jgi:hypothetical protein
VEPQVEGPTYEDNANVYYRARPKVVLEEQNVNTDHDGNERKHVKHAVRSTTYGATLPAALRIRRYAQSRVPQNNHNALTVHRVIVGSQ